MDNKPNKEDVKNIGLLILIILLVGAGITYTKYARERGDQTINKQPAGSGVTFKKFTSEDEFKKYLQDHNDFEDIRRSSGFANEATKSSDMVIDEPLTSPGFEGGGMLPPSPAIPGRVSETNIQVAGIDEPDILKTNGKEIYYSSESYQYYPTLENLSIPVDDFGMMPLDRPQYSAETKVFKAFPPAELAKRAGIPIVGQLLISDSTLIIIGTEKIVGYNISDASNPKEAWNIELESNNRLASARLYNGKLFMVTGIEINRSKPCPYIPMKAQSSPVEIQCSDIYYPESKIKISKTYTAAIINPASGKSEQTISFVGSDSDSVIYMSPNALYISYSYAPSPLIVLTNFFKTKGRDLVPASLIERLEKLNSYDISYAAKMTEFEAMGEEWQAGLSDDENLRVENELENRMDSYSKEHMRELEITDIVKINLSTFSLAATGKVPGHPLNQFSFDEYQDHLRVATTVGEIEFSSSSENDVYVLDNSLTVSGSVTGMGADERIYSVRFIGDRGYVVTFRETDPFYVLDLSNPNKPEKKGELKIPGYSSYLHPVKDHLILGIGRDNDFKIKLSLFDVSQADSPKEVSKYQLDEYSSENLNTQYAFLFDPKHEVFFIPGNHGGYIFSYQGNEISLKRAVSGISPRRALYLDDYLYLVSDNKITVLNENDWVEVKSLDF